MLRLLLASLLLSPSTALACSCAYGPMDWLPANGESGVATDASVWVTFNFLDSVEQYDPVLVRTDTGDAIETSLEQHDMGDTALLRWTPVEELAPNTEYEFKTVEGDDYEWVLTTFTTGSGPDTDTPLGGEILGDDTDRKVTSSGADCGTHLWLYLEISPGSDASSSVFYEVEATRDGETRTFYFLNHEWAGIGDGGCSSNLADISVGDRFELRSRAVDLAGNQGDWNDGEARVRACASVGAAPAAFGWLGLMVAAFLRRRA